MGRRAGRKVLGYSGSMTDRESFIRAICADPADRTLRLVYADWLEERGDPRGEFIRVQIRLSAGCPTCDGSGRSVMSPCPCSLLRTRERALFCGHLSEWARVPGWERVALGECPTFTVYDSCPQSNSPRGAFHCGFVEAILCTRAEWRAHGEAITACHPIIELWFTDRQLWSVTRGVDGTLARGTADVLQTPGPGWAPIPGLVLQIDDERVRFHRRVGELYELDYARSKANLPALLPRSVARESLAGVAT